MLDENDYNDDDTQDCRWELEGNSVSLGSNQKKN